MAADPATVSQGDRHPAIALVRRLRRSERHRVSTALHDQVGQLLTAAGLELEMARIDCLERDQDETAQQLARVASHLEDAFTRVRGLSYETHPDPVGKFGYNEALERYLDALKTRHPKRLRIRMGSRCEPQNNLAHAIYEIVTATLDFALDELYSSQVSFSTHMRQEGLQLRIRLSTEPNRKEAGATLDQQRNALEGIRELAASLGIQASVRWDRRCVNMLELHG